MPRGENSKEDVMDHMTLILRKLKMIDVRQHDSLWAWSVQLR